MEQNTETQPVEVVSNETTIEVVPASEKSSPEMAALDVAAKHFELYVPQFKNRIKMMSKKQLQRLILHLAEYPLEKVPYRHSEKLEKDAFLIGDKLFQSKYMMILFTLANSNQINESIKETLEEQPTTKTGEENNG